MNFCVKSDAVIFSFFSRLSNAKVTASFNSSSVGFNCHGDMVAGIGIIIYGYLIVTMVDNFIRMAIGKRIANTHPLITIIGVVIGIPIFGILGILYGPLIISLFIILAKIYRENRNEIIQLSGEDDNA